MFMSVSFPSAALLAGTCTHVVRAQVVVVLSCRQQCRVMHVAT